jgi:hypothetical protein
MNIFNRLPHDINKLIGSYLDYNSRVELSRVFSHVNDKFVRKLNAKDHDINVHIRNIKNYLDKNDEVYGINNKIRITIRCFKYLIRHVNSGIFERKRFLDSVNQKANWFKDRICPDYNSPFIKQKLKRRLISVSRHLSRTLYCYELNCIL